MHIKSEFELQTIRGKCFLFLRKGGEVDMTRILSFNNSSVWLWDQLIGKEFTESESFQLLEDHYIGDEKLMKENLLQWLRLLCDKGVIEP